jgi:hypothetical protein
MCCFIRSALIRVPDEALPYVTEVYSISPGSEFYFLVFFARIDVISVLQGV